MNSKTNEAEFTFPRLETERLVLRLLTLQDAAAVCRHFSDTAVIKFMDIEPCKSVAEAKEIIGFHLRDSGCRWGIFDKVTAKLLGTCGYHCWVRGGENANLGQSRDRLRFGAGLLGSRVDERDSRGCDCVWL